MPQRYKDYLTCKQKSRKKMCLISMKHILPLFNLQQRAYRASTLLQRKLNYSLFPKNAIRFSGSIFLSSSVILS